MITKTNRFEMEFHHVEADNTGMGWQQNGM